MNRNFGVGQLIATRTDIANATPAVFGILQDFSLDFSFDLKPLNGQYQASIDIARAQQKITGKAKSARIYSQTFNLFFGETLTSSSGVALAQNEAHTIPAVSGPYTVQVANHSTFIADEGVFYTGTSGTGQLTQVASSPSAGQYSIAASTGTYTFASADASALILVNYSYGITSAVELSGQNQLMGTGPVFSILLAETFNQNGVAKIFNIQLNRAVASKLSFGFKNTDWTIPDFEFECMADDNNNVYTITTSE